MASAGNVKRLGQGAAEWNRWRSENPDLRPDLRRAALGRISLEDVDLTEADLRGADLSETTGLLERQLARAQLAGACLPKGVGSFVVVEHVNEACKNARPLFFSTILACFYCCLTISTTVDLDLIMNSTTSKLPIIGTTIPLVGFYTVAPIVLLSLFIYFHLYLQRVWHDLAQLPAVMPDGRELDEVAYPWLLTSQVSSGFFHLQKRQRPLRSIQTGLCLVLAWWIVPMTLVFIWLRYLPRHDWVLTVIHIAFVTAAIVAAGEFRVLAVRTLAGISWDRQEPRRRGWLRRTPKTAFFIGFTLGFVSYSAHRGKPDDVVHRIAGLVGYKFYADLGENALMPSDDELLRILGEDRPDQPNVSGGSSPAADEEASAAGLDTDSSRTMIGVRQEARPAALERFQGVDLSGRNLRYVRAFKPYLVNADLESADLTGASLERAVLVGANLKGADLRGADLRHADLRWSNLVDAKLDHADIMGARLRGASFTARHGSKRRLGEDSVEPSPQLLVARNWVLAKLTPTQRTDLNVSHYWMDEKNLSGANLTEFDLRGAQLSGYILQRADFKGADLRGATLDGANLAQANLEGADLCGATFVGADLRYARLPKKEKLDIDAIKEAKNWVYAAFDDEVRHELGLKRPFTERTGLNLENDDFTETQATRLNLSGERLARINLYANDLTGANLEGADLKGANLKWAVLKNASLVGADLTRARLDNAVLTGADLKDALLQDATFSNYEVRTEAVNWVRAYYSDDRLKARSEDGIGLPLGHNALLENRNLSDYPLRGSILIGSDLAGFDLRGAKLSGANLDRADLSGANLTGAVMAGASLIDANLDQTILKSTDLKDANLSGAKMRDARLDDAVLTRSILDGADLSRANLTGARLVAASLKKTKLISATLINTNLTNGQLVLANLGGAKLDGAILTDSRLNGANLLTATFDGTQLRNVDLRSYVRGDVTIRTKYTCEQFASALSHEWVWEDADRCCPGNLTNKLSTLILDTFNTASVGPDLKFAGLGATEEHWSAFRLGLNQEYHQLVGASWRAESMNDVVQLLATQSSAPVTDPPKRSTFSRAKAFIHVGTIGQVGHGKTTLTEAIVGASALKGLARKLVRTRGGDITTIAAKHVEYETESRHYLHFNSAGLDDFVKNSISGMVPLDGAILVVSAVDGLTSQTREYIRWAEQTGVKRIVVFLNKIELVEDEELLDLVDLDVRELLDRYGYDETPVIRGSARLALSAVEQNASVYDERLVPIWQLLDAVDLWIEIPKRKIDRPFLLAIEDVFSIKGRGTLVTGRIERGVVKGGDEVEIVGLGETRKTLCGSLVMFNKNLAQGQAGDNVGVLLRDVKRDEVQRGQVLCKPESIKPHTVFDAVVYILTQNEGGRHTPFFNGYRPQFYFRTTDVTGSIALVGAEMAMPGDIVEMSITLSNPIAMEPGLRFAVREGGRTVGSGLVTAIRE